MPPTTDARPGARPGIVSAYAQAHWGAFIRKSAYWNPNSIEFIVFLCPLNALKKKMEVGTTQMISIYGTFHAIVLPSAMSYALDMDGRFGVVTRLNKGS